MRTPEEACGVRYHDKSRFGGIREEKENEEK
jgi:hypothetical protein